MKPITKFILAAFAVTTLVPITALAVGETKNQGYLIETSESAIVRSGTGLCWHTGEWAAARGADACDPSAKPVVAAAPAPAPIVIAALAPVTKPEPQKIQFSGDAMFAFDKAVLKPEGEAMLDGLVRQVQGATYDTIVVTGHTDHFGSDKYNQNLSEHRAQAVKDYLVSKNVLANRIDAAGKGETQPVTKADDCKGAKTQKSVACLQPDRRVEVEMTGSRTVASAQ
jgi:OmpA-OmpF porin, OOP family